MLKRSAGRFRSILGAAAAFLVLAACSPPLGIGLPSTRELESGVTGSLDAARSLELNGSYSEAGERWQVDLQLVRPGTEHVSVHTPTLNLEAILLGRDAYFRGRDFLSRHLGTDPVSQGLVRAAGDAWWKEPGITAPTLSDFTDGARFTATFLGSVVTQRIDGLALDGVAVVELSGPRAEVYVTEAAPHRPLRVLMHRRAVVDGISAADLRFRNFNFPFSIVAPSDVIDFADQSTLPPNYTVISIDVSACGSPCILAAEVRNLGGTKGARAVSTVTFTVTAAPAGEVLGSCRVRVQPDVDYKATTKVSCTVDGLTGRDTNGAAIVAAPDNPGRA